MEDHSQDHLRILGQLALEYEQKYRELEEFVRTAQPDSEILHQIKLSGERATARFRGAQVALLKNLASNAADESEDVYQAATTLSRCFDEMRILLEILLEYVSKSGR